MALILKYRLEPPDGINQQVYRALSGQVGKVSVNVQVPLDPDDPDKAVIGLRGDFISVEGEHFEERRTDAPPACEQDVWPPPRDDRTVEERRSGPSSDEANRAACEGGP